MHTPHKSDTRRSVQGRLAASGRRLAGECERRPGPRALSEAIDPLLATPRLQDPTLQEVSILALGIDADVVMASGEEMTMAEARLAESVASEEVPQPVADYAPSDCRGDR